MRRKQFDAYYAKYLPAIRAIARKLAHKDDALAEDLEQEGAWALLKLDPSRAKTNESAWVRRAVHNRMVDFLRRYNPKVYVSLDARFEAGDQLEQSEDTGELTLFSNGHQRHNRDLDLPNLHRPGEGN
ncbi:MAG: sigma-70 family RNA polymerase sigma factor, partial [Lysobacterales bacterium]